VGMKAENMEECPLLKATNLHFSVAHHLKVKQAASGKEVS